MKKPSSALFACLALASVIGAAAQTSPRLQNDRPAATSPAPVDADQLDLAPPEAVDRTVRKLAGQVVYGPKGERIGTVKDFVIEKQTGRVVYAVVSTGGMLGMGDALKLIPIHALLAAPAGAAGFSIRVSRADWDRLPALIDEAFGHGLVIVSDEQRHALDTAFGPTPRGQPVPPPAAELPRDRAAALAASPWIRATQLRGKTLAAGADTVGAIEDVVIDLRRGTAVALLDLEDSILGGDRRVVVPLTEIALDRTTSRVLPTHYTRAQFAQLDAAERQRLEKNLLPTGRPSPEPASAAEATLASAARSARQALDAHADLARADIRVTPEAGMLILRGRVRTEQLKAQAESAVRDAASGIRLQNYLIVDPR